MENFQSLGLPEALLQSLELMNFHKPTPVQAETIPIALKGTDILGSAQTGTGKTAAYGIPLIAHLINNPDSSALVLTPTRELALQVLETLKQLLGKRTNIQSTLLIGGEPIFKQFKQLKARPRLIVGTPGRVNDHLLRHTLKLDKANFIVFDETDRMLDMGFTIQLKQIAKFLPTKRQTLMFSATLANEIIKTAQIFQTDAVRISIGSTTSPIEKIKQDIIRISESEKYDLLVKQLNQFEGSMIVFVKTKSGTEKLVKRLRASGHNSDAIHGDLRQSRRDRVIRAFRECKNRILVATDVAARGLDIPHVECVVNYDLPQCPEDYIHRIGRTGRAGSEGTAVSLVTPQDRSKWGAIFKLMNPGAKMDPEHAPANNNNKKKKRYGGGFGRGRGFGGGGNNENGGRREGGGKNFRFNRFKKRNKPQQSNAA